MTKEKDGARILWVRPLGGSVEVGELAKDALLRELQEELGEVFVGFTQIGVLENRYEVNAEPGHEIDFLFLCEPSDPELFEMTEIPIMDPSGATATWWTPDDEGHLVPEGLQGLLEFGCQEG